MTGPLHLADYETAEDLATFVSRARTLEDDGAGLPEPLTEGFGLRSLRARAEKLGGTLRLSTKKPRGTRLVLELPLG